MCHMISPTHWITEYYQRPPAPFFHDRQEQTVFKSSGLCRRQKEQADRFIVSNISVFCMTNVNKSIYHPVSPWYVGTAVLVTTAVTGDTAHGWSWSAAWPHETIYFIFDIGNILPSAPAPGAHWHLINSNTGSRVSDRYFQSSDWGHKRPFQWSFYVLPLQWFCSPT